MFLPGDFAGFGSLALIMRLLRAGGRAAVVLPDGTLFGEGVKTRLKESTKDIWFYEHREPEGQKAYSMTTPIKVEHVQPCADWWAGTKREGRGETEVAWRVTADRQLP